MNMYRYGLALLTSLGVGVAVSAADVQQAGYDAGNSDAGLVAQVSCCDCGEVACGCEPVAPSCGCEGFCDGGCSAPPSCGCEGSCDGGCYSPGIEQIFHRHMGRGRLLDGSRCCLEDPLSLFGSCGDISMGGWVQTGYHNNANTLFNGRPHEYQLHQAWLWAENTLDTSCGFDIGGRIDYLYGTDSQDTQAFGTDPRGFDNDWDNGPDYGHALPQVYMSAGYGDLSVKVGHFYTIIGYEVVSAPDNFFYSHAYTMYNSEPFTHTGALATLALSDDVEVYGGYTFGWDSGFDDNGDSFLGGMSVNLTDEMTLIYATTAGRFGEARFNGVEQGYMHSIVVDYAVTENLQYISQSDLLDTEDNAGNTVRDTYGLNQYLVYTVNDCLALGSRFEWWENEGIYTQVGETADIYALTLGLNYKPHANVTIRPEVRWDWIENNTANQAAVAADPNTFSSVIADGDDRQTTFGIDTIITF